MKTTVDKCEECGILFEDEEKYKQHCETHSILTVFEGAFPSVQDDSCKFANGGWAVQRSEDWLNRYKARLIEVVGDIKDQPFSYGWFRRLDDGRSPFYGIALRVTNVCPSCFREWGQPFYANNCNHQDKERN